MKAITIRLSPFEIARLEAIKEMLQCSPEVFWHGVVNMYIGEAQNSLRKQGIDIDDYINIESSEEGLNGRKASSYQHTIA